MHGQRLNVYNQSKQSSKGKGVPSICLLIPAEVIASLAEALFREVQKNPALFDKSHPLCINVHHQTAIGSCKNIGKTCLQRMTAQAKEYLMLPALLSSAAIHEPKSLGYVGYLLFQIAGNLKADR